MTDRPKVATYRIGDLSPLLSECGVFLSLPDPHIGRLAMTVGKYHIVGSRADQLSFVIHRPLFQSIPHILNYLLSD